MLTDDLPQISHIYQNHHLDSTRWERFVPRDDDIVISTSYKSGTTWTQMIVAGLVFGAEEAPYQVMELSPWVDSRYRDIDSVIERLDSQNHRRFIKTHLPLDGLPYYSQVKYIVTGRDARDVCMSLWNHYSNYTEAFHNRVNTVPGRVGPPLPLCPGDVRTFWRNWISRGWFDWESDGYPFWTNLGHTQSWWDYRQLPNILFVHFADLLNDLSGEIRRIADYLNIEISDESLAFVTNAVRFPAVKANAQKVIPNAQDAFVGGADTFFNKGTNGRWKSALTLDDIGMYHEATARILSADCAQWLETGRRIDGLTEA
jgi:aryl sulfotransferase